MARRSASRVPERDCTFNLLQRIEREFFFSSRSRHTRFGCDWSSDVCSSDLLRESTWTTHGHDVRPLRADLELVHLEWTIAGERDTDGSIRPPRSGVFTWIVDYQGGAPLIDRKSVV